MQTHDGLWLDVSSTSIGMLRPYAGPALPAPAPTAASTPTTGEPPAAERDVAS